MTMVLVLIKTIKIFLCKCGAKKCVGFIVNSQSRWRIKKIEKSENLLISNFIQV